EVVARRRQRGRMRRLLLRELDRFRRRAGRRVRPPRAGDGAGRWAPARGAPRAPASDPPRPRTGPPSRSLPPEPGSRLARGGGPLPHEDRLLRAASLPGGHAGRAPRSGAELGPPPLGPVAIHGSLRGAHSVVAHPEDG